jgi:hypothetical protein
MKHLLLTTKRFLLLCGLSAILPTANARILRVNNNIGVTPDLVTLFPKVADAVNAALTGDTVYVEPSPITYDNINGTLSISRKITIVGNGSFLAAAGNAGLQSNTNDSYFGCNQVTFAAGSAGTAIYGMRISGNLTINDAVSNITIRRCRFNALTITGAASNNSILENWFSYLSRSASAGVFQTNLLIRNNVINSSGATTNAITMALDDAAVLENNTVIGGLDVAKATRTFVFNNIFSSTTPVIRNQSGVAEAFKNNIVTDASLPTGNGNLNNVTIANVFTTYPFSGTNDRDIELRAGSVAIDAGLHGNGDDIGAVNNGTNRQSYIYGMIPPFPTIYAVSGIGIVNTPNMSVTISSRSNN